MKIVRLGNIYENNSQNGRIYDSYGIAPTIRGGSGIKGNGVGSCNSPLVVVYE